MAISKPFIIQRLDQATETWSNLWRLHASVNKTKGSEFVEGGANVSQSTKTFETRWFKALEDVDTARGLYRILYRGHTYNIVDYDDFMESHINVKITAVSYGD